MLLKDKTALIFAATGAIGSAVARRLAAEGARVFISGRNPDALQLLARELDARWQVVDATNEGDVRAYIERFGDNATDVDIVFNAIGPRPLEADYATPSTEMPFENFMLPLKMIVGSQFLTARTAVRHMAKRHSGAIVTLSASLSGMFVPFMSGITAACGAVEAMTRTLAAEFGPAGVRVNCVRAAGMPETRTIRETVARMSRTTGRTSQEAEQRTVANVLQRPVRVDETARTVAYVASDYASGVVGQVINVCAGAIVS